MERFCCNCKWFRDAQMHRVYKTPRCSQRGDDDAMYMRQYVCGLDGTLYEAKETEYLPQPPLPLPA